MNRRFGKSNLIVVYILLIFFSFLYLLPYFWTITSAFKSKVELNSFPPKWIPGNWRIENFVNAWTSQPFGRYLFNSTMVVIGTTAGQIVSCSLTAYGFARFRFPGRDFLFVVLLSSMMIPWDVTVIPLYMEFNLLGWINTLKPLVVPSWFGSAFYIFLLRQFFLNVPDDLQQAAELDGANPFQTFYFIFLPLIRPILILVGLFNMMTTWNDYLGPLVFLNDQSKYTLTLGLSQFKGVGDMDMSSTMAITTLICIPPLIIFFFTQKKVSYGMSMRNIR